MYLMSSERIKLCHAVAKAAVAVDDPHLAVGTYQFRPESEAAAHAQRAERARVQPPQRATRSTQKPLTFMISLYKYDNLF